MLYQCGGEALVQRGGSFLSIMGSSVQDLVNFTVATQSCGTQDAPGTMYFAKSGSD